MTHKLDDKYVTETAPVDFDPFAYGEALRKVPATGPQQEIWTATRIDEQAARAFNTPLLLRLRGDLQVPQLGSAFSELIRRHDALRGSFSPDGTEFVVATEVSVPLPLHDLSSCPAEARDEALSTIVETDTATPFILEFGPLIRSQLIKLDEADHILLITVHHIICDGWSTNILFNELAELYSAEIEKRQPNLAPAPSFADYAQELRGKENSESYLTSRNYWLKQYATDPPVLDLPLHKPRPSVRTFNGNRYDCTIDLERTRALNELASRSGSTLFITLFGIFQILLWRRSGQADIVIGFPAAAQPTTDHPGLIGHCVHLLPIRFQLDGKQTFAEHLETLRPQLYDALEHQEFTFGSLMRELHISRDSNRIPLVPVSFNLENCADEFRFSGLNSELSAGPRRNETFEIFLNVIRHADKLELQCSYNSDLFSLKLVKTMMWEFEVLIDDIIASANKSIEHLDIVSSQELNQLTHWNHQTGVEFDGYLIHKQVEDTRNRFPQEIAVICGKRTLTYEQLDQLANQLAHHLRNIGVDRNQPVGICIHRSIDMLCGLLGILKAGGAYVPLDPEYPQERLSYMLKTAGVQILLTETALKDICPEHSCQRICMDQDWNEWLTQADAPDVSLVASDLAYVIFTSGSTGRPKGVQVSHGAMMNFLHSMARRPGFREQDRILSVTTLSFDIAVLELYLPLIVGGTTIIAERESVTNGQALAALIEEHDVTVMQATPSTWRLLLLSGWRGKQPLKALCGGEAFPQDLAQDLVGKVSEVWNMYGPTETTVWSTCCPITNPDEPILIGRPIANTQCYVLDAARQLLPIGVPGELYIGGAGVASGYINQMDLTTERFVDNQFGQKPGRMYRTGDLVRWDENGSLEYLHRLDHQVKVRGHRIELREIESVMNGHDNVAQAVAIVREDRPGDQRLVGYYRSTDGDEISSAELRELLKKSLPNYMVPTAFFRLDDFPLTPNGKIDRKSLPIPEDKPQSVGETQPASRDHLELQLTKLWEEILGKSPIGMSDDFFEIGGHSLLAVHLFTRIEETLGANLPLATLFTASTIKELAELLRRDGWSPSWASLVPIQPAGSKPPLFCIHGAEGNVLLYKDLARHLGDDQPFYGLQAKGLDGGEAFLTSLDEMAVEYIRELKTVQSHGPYFVGGYCLGGTLAYEVAQQLHDQGDEVAIVFLFETYNINAPRTKTSRLHQLGLYQKIKNVGFHLQNLRLLSHKDRIRFLQNKMRVAKDRIWRAVYSCMGTTARQLWMKRSNRSEMPHVRLAAINDEAQRRYEPKKYDGKVTLFRPTALFPGWEDENFGWRELADVETIVLPVYPHGMLVEPFVKNLADLVSERLSKAYQEKNSTDSGPPQNSPNERVEGLMG